MTRARSSVPWALLLPLATTSLFLLWWTQRDERSHAPPFTPLVEETWSVEGWSAVQALGAGRGRLSVRLWPLHAVPELQAFDAAALARRLGLAPGEPWLAELTWSGAGALSTHGAGAALLLEAGRLAVLDDAGEALAPLAPAPLPAAEYAPADPLAVLLAPPLEGLGPDQSLSVLLWGRAPGEPEATGSTPRLAGLRWQGGERLAPLSLEATTHAAAGLPRDLARLAPERGEEPRASGVR